jgi:hypothetical protein
VALEAGNTLTTPAPTTGIGTGGTGGNGGKGNGGRGQQGCGQIGPQRGGGGQQPFPKPP